ncbi:MAG: SH3 domain-containing protein [Candidatus Andersenbacteria bacterium]|nr:SH3 domain-containing protein [Candidatus Andersenbacteria bacterium]
MIPLPFWLTNLQFIIGAFGAFAFFAAAWLNVDSWAVRRELKTGLRAAGFFALALWSALHGIDLSSPWATVLAALLMAGGSLTVAVSYFIDRPPAQPKDTSQQRAAQQKKIDQIVHGPAETIKPHPPEPGAPLARPAQLANTRHPVSPQPKFYTPPTPTAKAIGLRTEALLKLPKREQRRRARLLASMSIFLFFAALAAAGAYFFYAKTKLFKSDLPEASFIESTPTIEPSPEPSPTPDESRQADAAPSPDAAPAKTTVTIKDTETGYLNVRESASTAAAIIIKINPGSSHTLLEETEQGDWYKIQVDDDTVGWIASRYATKNDE